MKKILIVAAMVLPMIANAESLEDKTNKVLDVICDHNSALGSECRPLLMKFVKGSVTLGATVTQKVGVDPEDVFTFDNDKYFAELEQSKSKQ